MDRRPEWAQTRTTPAPGHSTRPRPARSPSCRSPSAAIGLLGGDFAMVPTTRNHISPSCDGSDHAEPSRRWGDGSEYAERLGLPWGCSGHAEPSRLRCDGSACFERSRFGPRRKATLAGGSTACRVPPCRRPGTAVPPPGPPPRRRRPGRDLPDEHGPDRADDEERPERHVGPPPDPASRQQQDEHDA